jgi:uroporphyrinogen III methyltransferase / synthase
MTVYLVGAGPGDPGLLTLRGRELLARCDAVVYDRLADARIVGMANAAAERHDAGKRAGHHAMSQEEINGLLVELARRHATVVRLKGGDPFIFGRGGEEALALEQAGVAFEIVPGISSAYAVPAYAGIPVTQRGMAAQVTIVTGHEDPEKAQSDLDWTQLAHTPGTLVLLMGVGALAENMGRLVEHGMDGGTPAAVIASGTRPSQRTVVGTVGTIANLAARARIRPPAITLVGAVAALRDRLAWFERRPLFGCSVVVTRARAQASGLAARLADLGAEVVEAPAIRIEPLPFQRPALDAYDVVVLTSANGVEQLLEGDVRVLHGVTVAAIGSATADALRGRGIEPDLIPPQAMSESLLEALSDVDDRRVLIATAADARPVLPDGLRERGAQVDVLALYRTRREPVETEAVMGADLVTFTSSSTVATVLDGLAGRDLSPLHAVSIGPITTRALRDRGIDPVAEADPHDVDGLVEAVVRAAGALPAAEPPLE